jgi:hypothetical protein
VVIDHFDRPWLDLDHKLGHSCEFDSFAAKPNAAAPVPPYWYPMPGGPLKEERPGSSARSPRCECPHCVSAIDGGTSYPPQTHSDYDNIVPSDTEALSEHQYLLCWDQMFGFILKDRRFGMLRDPSRQYAHKLKLSRFARRRVPD